MCYIVVINKNDTVSVEVFTDEIKAKACFWHNVAINMERIKAYCFSKGMEYDFSKQETPIKYNLMDDAYNLGFILLTESNILWYNMFCKGDV
mgnify:FL=1